MNILSKIGILRRCYRPAGEAISPLSVSFAVTACNEAVQLDELLSFLERHLREQDEIVVQIDAAKSTDDVRDVLEHHHNSIARVAEYALNMDFAAAKNHLNALCHGDYIFQLDADEMPSEYLIDNVPHIIAANPKIELFKIPRNNCFDNEDGSVTKFVSWPDYQGRLYRNRAGIEWRRPLHEKIHGHERYVYLPKEERLAIIHRKNRVQDTIKWREWTANAGK